MWKTKKDFIKAMKPVTRVFYYMRVIKHIDYLPTKISGELEYKDGYYQVLKNDEYMTYYKWNWWNPLTYIIKALIFSWAVFINVIIAIVDIFAANNIFTVKINQNI